MTDDRFVRRVELYYTKKVLRIIDEIADLIIFHARVHRNALAMMKPWSLSEETDYITPVVNKFYEMYTKHNDIFKTIESYVTENNMGFELIMLPVRGELCSCVFTRNDRIFMYINSEMVFEEQFFYAAYNLYKIYEYLDENNKYIPDIGVLMLTDSDTDDHAGMFAQAFMKKVGSIEDTQTEKDKIRFGSLKEHIKENIRLDVLCSQRKKHDKRRINEIKKMFGKDEDLELLEDL